MEQDGAIATAVLLKEQLGKGTVAKELTKHYVDEGEEKKWQKMNKEQITGKGGDIVSYPAPY